MADIVKTRSNLQLTAEFVDNDDRILTLDNPASLTTAQFADSINAIGEYIKDNNAIIGDKEGANFLRFKSAKKVTTTSTIYDLT